MIFDNATVITMNPRREIIANGAVVMEGRYIIGVGKSREMRERFPSPHDHRLQR